MRINKFSKNIIITSMVFGAMVLNGTTSSKAVLQSNGNDGATYNLNDWMVNVRKMEELGGAMGLSETLNSNLTSSSDSDSFCASVITMERRSAPIMILSFAFSNSTIDTTRLLPRAANSAASFTRFARSAPEKPGVPRAMIAASISGANGTRRM